MSSSIPVQWDLRLLGYWSLKRDQQQVTVAFRQQRLIAALALRGARRRRHVAGMLWPDRASAQASGSLRACLWNIAHQLPGLLDTSGDPLTLNPALAVDVDRLQVQIARLDDGGETPAELTTELRCADLLPGWDEDWLRPDQDRLFRQRITALEHLAVRHLAAGQFPAALDAVSAAVTLDPLLESAQRVLLRIHLAAGNQASAVRSYRSYETTLMRECGVHPSPRITEVIAPLLHGAESIGAPAQGQSVGVGLQAYWISDVGGGAR